MTKDVYFCVNCVMWTESSKKTLPVFCPVCGKIMNWIEDFDENLYMENY